MPQSPYKVLREINKSCFLDVIRLAVVSNVDLNKAVTLELTVFS